MTEHSVSIITVHYEDLEGLQLTAASVRALKENSKVITIEWILIDGGSDFSKNLSFKKDLELTAEIFISEADDGIYHAMNKGISYIRCNWAIFMNAGDTFFSASVLDDIFQEPKELERIDIIYGAAFEGTKSQDSDFKLPRGPKKLWWGMPTHHQAMLFKTRSLKEFKYDESMRIAADYKLVCLMSQEPKAVKLYLKPICFFDTTGISSNQFYKGLLEQQKIRSSVLGINFIVNAVIFCTKMLARSLRKLLPKVYKIIRYDK